MYAGRHRRHLTRIRRERMPASQATRLATVAALMAGTAAAAPALTATAASAATTTATATATPDVAPTFDSGNCTYANGPLIQGIQTVGVVLAKAAPEATLSLSGQPDWIQLAYQSIALNTDGTVETTGGLQTVAGAPIVDGQYTFQVEATNSVGSVLEPYTVVEAPGVDQPTFLSAASATATVGTPFSFQVSAVGCPPITGYRISSNPADVPWLTLDQNTGVLSGIPTSADAGTHTISITAAPEGSGTPITQTFTLTVNGPAATAPGAPAIGTATAGNGQATVSFTPPASDGGSAITGYTVTATDTTNPANGGQTATGTSSPVTVTGLTNGDRYTFTVKATNAVGTGPASAASSSVTPTAPVVAKVPGAPSVETVQPGNGRALVTFRGPASNGGSPVTGYTVTATDLSDRGGSRTATGVGSPITVSGLTGGDRYAFTVTAANAFGTGPASAPSETVLPKPPAAPTADLSVSLGKNPTAKDGSTFTEQVTVTNRGPSTATDVVINVSVSNQFTVTAAPGGRKTSSLVSWTDGSLGAGRSVTYTFTVKVGTRARGTALIAASADSKVKDPNPLNNWAGAAVKLS
jgi:hypothetical protein